MTLTIDNRQARRLWLWTNGLAQAPTGPLDVLAIIKRLGFVQIDTIRNVSRAHHHILWSRNQNYREPMLWKALAQDRTLFEHFSHDACLIPMEFYPMWQRQFRRMGERTAKQDWFQSGLGRQHIEAIKQRITDEGPLSTHDFDTKIEGPREMWSRPPHKKALDQMWYAGVLATSHRRNFTKFYDLAERVIPQAHRQTDHSDQTQIDWLCHAALDRLSFASPGEIRRFWEAKTPAEVKDWIDRQTDLQTVNIIAADKSILSAMAPADIQARLQGLADPSNRLRILNPFDPAVRDRNRLKALFGFDYKNEMFVPKAQRRWGYYVYPLLQRDRFVGRIEIKADRSKDRMQVTGFWQEPGVKWGAVRQGQLRCELKRFAALAGITTILWD